MKKLFLTSFVFTTGEVEYKDYRLVVVTKTDVERYKQLHKDDPMKSDDIELSIAYQKFSDWFPAIFPESVLTHHIAYPAIL